MPWQWWRTESGDLDGRSGVKLLLGVGAEKQTCSWGVSLPVAWAKVKLPNMLIGTIRTRLGAVTVRFRDDYRHLHNNASHVESGPFMEAQYGLWCPTSTRQMYRSPGSHEGTPAHGIVSREARTRDSMYSGPSHFTAPIPHDRDMSWGCFNLFATILRGLHRMNCVKAARQSRRCIFLSAVAPASLQRI